VSVKAPPPRREPRAAALSEADRRRRRGRPCARSDQTEMRLWSGPISERRASGRERSIDPVSSGRTPISAGAEAGPWPARPARHGWPSRAG
ncbi:hypothetical protein FE72_15440, partial [Staphylococcus aureus]